MLFDDILDKDRFTVIAGPCVIESEDSALYSARVLKEICDNHSVNLIYKSSYDKANRSSIKGYRGPGLKSGLDILEKIRSEKIPVLTDIHSVEEGKIAATVCDIVQIPAFLCRQTDIIFAVSKYLG